MMIGFLLIRMISVSGSLPFDHRITAVQIIFWTVFLYENSASLVRQKTSEIGRDRRERAGTEMPRGLAEAYLVLARSRSFFVRDRLSISENAGFCERHLFYGRSSAPSSKSLGRRRGSGW